MPCTSRIIRSRRLHATSPLFVLRLRSTGCTCISNRAAEPLRTMATREPRVEHSSISRRRSHIEHRACREKRKPREIEHAIAAASQIVLHTSGPVLFFKVSRPHSRTKHGVSTLSRTDKELHPGSAIARESSKRCPETVVVQALTLLLRPCYNLTSVPT